jgi:hypothetical protein
MAYTKRGPFVNNSPPPWNATTGNHFDNALFDQDARITVLGNTVFDLDGRIDSLDNTVLDHEGRITLLEDAPAPVGGGNGLGWINVKDAPYNAKGDNSTDDTAAIRAALQAVPTVSGTSGGGVVFFPPGIYRVSGEIGSYIKPNTHIVGSEPSSRYWGYSTSVPPSNCAIRLASNFAGTSLFPFPANLRASSIRNISMFGANVAGGAHCWNFTYPDLEPHFTGQNFSIIGFTGDGIRGRMFASKLSNFFIGGNHGWGINQTERWSDVYHTDGFIAGNVLGALNADATGSSQTGYMMYNNIRFERSGWNSGAPTVPVNNDAPGIRVRNLANSAFVNCTTDANSGHGLDMSHDVAARGAYINTNLFTNCTFKRDGFGNMSSAPDRAGVYLKGFAVPDADRLQAPTFYNCRVLTGRADDGVTQPAYVHPMRGVHAELTTYLHWIGPTPKGSTTASNWHFGTSGAGSNYRPQIWDMESGIMTMYRSSTRPSNPFGGGTPGVNQFMFDSNTDNIIIFDGTNWRDVVQTPVKSYVDADFSSGALTVAITDPKLLYFNFALSAARTVNLPGSGSGRYTGMMFRIVRGASATGAFNLVIATGTAKNLTAANTWADVVYTGSAWIVTASGTL